MSGDATPLLTVDEVAHRLSVPLSTAYRLLRKDGPLHHLRIELAPNTVRVHPEQLRQHLESHNNNKA